MFNGSKGVLEEKAMRQVILTVMAVMLTAAGATTVSAFGFGRGPGYGPCPQGAFQGPVGIELTEEQADKIRQLQRSHWQEMKDLQQQTFAKRDELRKLWLEPEPDEEKIAEAQKEMWVLRDQIDDKTRTFNLEVSKILTPEQMEKAKLLGKRRVLMPGGSAKLRFGWKQKSDPVPPFGFGETGRAVCFGCP